MEKAIGIDIGGTKISMTAGNEHGKILAQKVIPTLSGRRTREGIEQLAAGLAEIRRRAGGKISGIGVGIPGPVDSKKGIVPRSPHLPGWEGLPLQKILQKKMKAPVLMGNDANAAGLGEKIFGQGRGRKNFIYMTVSTGIGSGIIVDGKLLERESYVAGEVGHMTLVPDGARCKCGKKGCLEAYASGTAIARMGKEEYSRQKKTAVLKKWTGGRPVTAQALGLVARRGDPTALQVYRCAGFYLGTGIANLLNILNPELIILGGGVWNSAPKDFWNAMMKSCKRDAWPQALKAVKIVRSKLGGHAGDLGALALGFEAAKTKK